MGGEVEGAKAYARAWSVDSASHTRSCRLPAVFPAGCPRLHNVLLLVLVLGAIARFWWVIAAALAVAVIAAVLWKFVGWLDRRLDARDAQRAPARAELAALAARAEQQNALFLAGDDRGVYGDYPRADLTDDAADPAARRSRQHPRVQHQAE
jgi:hypothetical protein